MRRRNESNFLGAEQFHFLLKRHKENLNHIFDEATIYVSDRR